MIYNVCVGESKGLNTIKALERAKTDAMNQVQIGFLKSAVQSAINNSLN